MVPDKVMTAGDWANVRLTLVALAFRAWWYVCAVLGAAFTAVQIKALLGGPLTPRRILALEFAMWVCASAVIAAVAAAQLVDYDQRAGAYECLEGFDPRVDEDGAEWCLGSIPIVRRRGAAAAVPFVVDFLRSWADAEVRVTLVAAMGAAVIACVGLAARAVEVRRRVD